MVLEELGLLRAERPDVGSCSDPPRVQHGDVHVRSYQEVARVTEGDPPSVKEVVYVRREE